MSPMHKLLIGTWKSDKRRTLQTWHHYHCMRGAKKRFLGGLFGILEVRYTREFVHHRLEDSEYRERYEVVAEDVESMVIRVHSDELKKHTDPILTEGLEDFFKPKLQQINFSCRQSDQYYWIG